MDVLKLETGSPLLGGDGFIPLDRAADAIGMTAPELAAEAANQNEYLHVFADGWACAVVPDMRDLELDYDGTFLEDDVFERGTPQRLREYLRWPDTRAVAAELAAGSNASECRFFFDNDQHKAAFLRIPGVTVPTAQILIHKAAAERVRNALRAGITPDMTRTAKAAASMHYAPPQGHKYATMKASELVAAFISAKVDGGAWKPDHRQKMETELGAFVELMNDPALNDMDRPAIERYRSLLRQLPANIYQARRRVGTHLTLTELAAQAAARGLPTMATTTVDGYVRRLSEMFGWAVRSDYMTKNPAQAAAPKRKATREQDARDAFSDEDLARIFGADWYKAGRGKLNSKGAYQTFQPHYYWLPLLGLYTGARINELSQLYLDDVKQTNAGAWYLDFNLDGADKLDADDAEGKSLKTVNAKRVVPLHGAVLRLGFIEYVKALRAAGHKRLFQELRYDRVKGYGKAATSCLWWSSYFGQVNRFFHCRFRLVGSGRQIPQG